MNNSLLKKELEELKMTEQIKQNEINQMKKDI